MKFGKTFSGHQIPEWSIYYMNYKSLKKIVKSLNQVVHYDNENNEFIVKSIISSFFFELDRDIEKVDSFYNTKFKEYSKRLEKVCQVLGYQNGKINHQIESNEELEELISILMELRAFYRNLKWYGELNHKGIIKILKKLDKKLVHVGEILKLGSSISTTNKENYLRTRVEALPFSNGFDLKNELDSINFILNTLGNDESTDPINNKFEFLRVGDRGRYSFDQEFLESYYNLISKDNAVDLITELKKVPESRLTLKFLLSLLNKAALFNSRNSMDCLLSFLNEFKSNKGINNPLFDESDISGKTFFHHHILSLGKKKVAVHHLEPGQGIDVKRFLGNENGPDGVQLGSASTDGLEYILSKVEDKSLLIYKDNYMRTPLHYSAQYGLKHVTKILLINLKKANMLNHSIDDLNEWGDRENLTPLHLAIIGKHPETTENLVNFSESKLTCSNLFLLAVQFNYIEILITLLKGGLNLNYTDPDHNNETALYIASKLNFRDLVKFLLDNGADTELGENVFGWTPIFVAASEGFKDIVELLLSKNCNYDIVDDSGWLPMEHASLRGHLDIADLLKPKNPDLLLYDIYHPEKNVQRDVLTSPALLANDDSLLSTSSIDKLPEPSKFTVNEVYKHFRNNGSTSSISRSRSPRRHRPKPVKSFGHRYLGQYESLILITLGTTDLRDDKQPIELNKISLSKSFSTELDTALSVLITCREKDTGIPVEPPVEVDLPLEDHHGSSTDPITFKLSNNLQADDVVITFDIVPTYQFTNNKKDKILGRAVALLNSTYTKVGPNLRSLNSCVTLPFIETSTLDILGSVRFEYLYAKSFEHPQMKISRSDTYWKQLVSTRVIGHRGLGKNNSGRKSLQLGENTVESFIAAASLGASYVEFDVQLTKDFVPVVYHDFTVAESGVDIPMHAMTAEQFLSLNESKGKLNSHFSFDDEALKRPRSMSTFIGPDRTIHEADDEIHNKFKNEIYNRMKFSKTWKKNGFKGNARGFSVASNFVTLEELFKKLPKNIGFNIELKYPMLDEAEQESMGEIAIDMNFYVDTILKVVYDENTSGRDILFSSFHPDICLLLSLKQPTMPILFLTEAGTTPMADIRASSLQNAIRFAKKWNLLGIVSAAQTLIKTPRLTQVVKSSGLVCVTYGTDNNETELATIQMRAGVDAVIVDNVLAVREGLRKHEDDFKDESSTSE